ncbi:integrase catalytic domain-containing protein [Trichonephila clavipes]|nr:integrase catalytic domain-containing protein [Trichonephila clavipes]
MLCSVTLTPKILLQNTWKLKLAWDSSLPEEIMKPFFKWWNEIKILSDVEIPRYFEINDSTQMHVFVDALVGVDLAGLLYIKRGDKVWIVLYTCAIYRTLHLELVSSLSIDAFLLFFRRFVARRRRPRIIYSDNGTNFRGAYNELGDIDWNEVSRYAEIQRITWKFIPLTAAWWGGFWERLVRTVKELLRRTLQKAIFTAKVIKELKRRFRNEYLGQLIQRQKQHPQSSNIEVGDIVLIGDDWIKRLQWPFARVIKLIPGKDDCGNDITNPPLQKVQQTDLSVSCPRPDILKATEQPQVTRYGRPVKKPDKLNLLTLTDIFH